MIRIADYTVIPGYDPGRGHAVIPGYDLGRGYAVISGYDPDFSKTMSLSA